MYNQTIYSNFMKYIIEIYGNLYLMLLLIAHMLASLKSTWTKIKNAMWLETKFEKLQTIVGSIVKTWLVSTR
jgi:hypothetical protein